MDYNKIIEVNGKIIDKALPKIEKAMVTDKWDCECVEAMTMALDNIKDALKIESMLEKDKTMEYSSTKMVYEPLGEDTEFMECISKIINKHGLEAGTKAIMTVINELMEDMKILHSKMYNNTMMKLRDIKHD